MKFTEHRDASLNMIRSYQPGLVKVNKQPIEQSCIISQHHIICPWPIHHLNELNPQLIDMLLALKPEVLILGTGEQAQFPPPHLFGYCAQHGISLEAMTNAAACRTYNVLTTEDRVVVLGLILSN